MNIIVAYHDGEPVSAYLASNLGNTAVNLLVASNERGLSCGSSYLVWKGIISSMRAGMKWYDFGGIDPLNNPHVYQFKLRMGGQRLSYIGAFDAYSNAAVKLLWKTGRAMMNFIKK